MNLYYNAFSNILFCVVNLNMLQINTKNEQEKC